MGFLKNLSNVIKNVNEGVTDTMGKKQESIARIQQTRYNNKSEAELKLIYQNHKNGIRTLSFEESMALKQELKDRGSLS